MEPRRRGWADFAHDGVRRRIVYLYIGYCVGTNDSEAFYYSNEPIELCAPPG